MTRQARSVQSIRGETSKVRLAGLSKQYGRVVALEHVDLEVRAGEFLTLLGPSGSGKTTILNLIAGMVAPTEGRIWIDSRDVTDLPPNRRELGMVFQNYALMPHMTVFENIAFPLRVRRVPGAEIKTRVEKALELVRLPGVERRKPAELSGGQQQRISIARCLVYNPTIILMDEPLGALDKKLREEMQLELKRLHADLGITALYVTHDQEEALTMSDRIVLMNKGHIEQVGTPADLYFHPATLFAAEFLGDSNILPGHVEMAGELTVLSTELGRFTSVRPAPVAESGREIRLMVRPESVVLLDNGEESMLQNRLSGRMVDTISFGGVIKSFVHLANGRTMTVQQLVRASHTLPASGDTVDLAWSAEDTYVFPAAGPGA